MSQGRRFLDMVLIAATPDKFYLDSHPSGRTMDFRAVREKAIVNQKQYHVTAASAVAVTLEEVGKLMYRAASGKRLKLLHKTGGSLIYARKRTCDTRC